MFGKDDWVLCFRSVAIPLLWGIETYMEFILTVAKRVSVLAANKICLL